MPSSTTAPADRPGRFLPGPRPRIIAHRGLALDGAENTMRAFQAALDAGADMLETDTHATADAVALAVHDPDLRRLTGDARRVGDVRAAEATGLRVAGLEPLCRLEDVLGGFDVPVNIDVKTRAAVVPAAEAIARTGSADRVCVTSFDGRTAAAAVRAVRRLTGVTPMRSPSVGTIAAFLGLLATGAPQRSVTTLLRPYGALQVPRRHRGYPIVSPRSIALAHRAGCEVHVWTIDDEQAMGELVELGVDGIVTNRSDLLARLLGR